MEQETKTKVIDEIKEITANAVAKKQDVAKLNFPNIIDKIKKIAAGGESFIKLPLSSMNEYDKALLVAEGFSVALVDVPRNTYESSIALGQYIPNGGKEWVIKW